MSRVIDCSAAMPLTSAEAEQEALGCLEEMQTERELFGFTDRYRALFDRRAKLKNHADRLRLKNR
jgi:hypothetical protein